MTRKLYIASLGMSSELYNTPAHLGSEKADPAAGRIRPRVRLSLYQAGEVLPVDLKASLAVITADAGIEPNPGAEEVRGGFRPSSLPPPRSVTAIRTDSLCPT
jgi:hypothetical protein